jgi:hypothetical protein
MSGSLSEFSSDLAVIDGLHLIDKPFSMEDLGKQISFLSKKKEVGCINAATFSGGYESCSWLRGWYGTRQYDMPFSQSRIEFIIFLLQWPK